MKTAPERSDEELMKSYGELGDSIAFTELYNRYESKLFAFFQKRLSGNLRSFSSDLFQKTWLKIHHSRKTFDAHQKFSSWVFSIALNTLRDEWKSKAFNEPNDELDETDMSASNLDAETALSKHEDSVRIEKAIALLPESQREALLLFEWEGFSTKEISELLGFSEEAVRQLVSRARKQVRKIIGDEIK